MQIIVRNNSIVNYDNLNVLELNVDNYDYEMFWYGQNWLV